MLEGRMLLKRPPGVVIKLQLYQKMKGVVELL